MGNIIRTMALLLADACGLVLAGGRSQRFGADKALAPWKGGRLMDAVVGALLAVFPEVLVVSKPGQARAFDDLRVRLIRDSRALAHPLSGLEAGLAASTLPWVFAAACDMPFLAPDLIRRLAAERPGARAVAARVGGQSQPWGAFYAKDALADVTAQLEAGGSAVGLLERLGARWLDLPAGAPAFTDLDDPAAYARAAKETP